MIVRYPYLGVLRSIMSYIELRLTIPNLPEKDQYDRIYKHIMKEVTPDDNILKYIVGKEKHDKTGKLVNEHFHIVMELKTSIKVDSVRKRLNRLGIKGPHMYMLRQIEDLLEEPDRWWRYSIKQNPAVAYKGFSEIEIDALHTAANDEYLTRMKEHKAAEHKQHMKNNFRNKLIKHLQEKYQGAHPTDKQIFLDTYKFYKDAHSTAPFTKMKDLLIDLKLELELLTPEEYYDSRLG